MFIQLKKVRGFRVLIGKTNDLIYGCKGEGREIRERGKRAYKG